MNIRATETNFVQLQGSARSVALTGGGGKSSLMACLAQKLAAQGQRVLSTTSTRIALPSGAACRAWNMSEPSSAQLSFGPPSFALPPLPGEVLLSEGLTPQEAAPWLQKALDALPEGNKRLTLGRCLNDSGEKILGQEAAWLCELFRLLPAGRAPGLTTALAPVLLVEADGAARLPLKAHAEHEPVIPACCDLTLAVAGLDALGKSWGEAVHRAELGLALLEQSGANPPFNLERAVSPEDMAFLLIHPQGPLRGARGRRAIFLNKLDVMTKQGTEDRAESVAGLLLTAAPALSCYAGSVQEGRILRYHLAG